MLDLLVENWALVAASVLVAGLTLQGLYVLAGRTPAARLRRARLRMQARRQDALRARRLADRARRRCERLEGRSQSIRPVKLAAARESQMDAESRLKIARDQVLVAENQLRRVIVEHYPPAKQDKLRARYRVGESASDKPFTF